MKERVYEGRARSLGSADMCVCVCERHMPGLSVYLWCSGDHEVSVVMHRRQDWDLNVTLSGFKWVGWHNFTNREVIQVNSIIFVWNLTKAIKYVRMLKVKPPYIPWQMQCCFSLKIYQWHFYWLIELSINTVFFYSITYIKPQANWCRSAQETAAEAPGYKHTAHSLCC